MFIKVILQRLEDINYIPFSYTGLGLVYKWKLSRLLIAVSVPFIQIFKAYSCPLSECLFFLFYSQVKQLEDCGYETLVVSVDTKSDKYSECHSSLLGNFLQGSNLIWRMVNHVTNRPGA